MKMEKTPLFALAASMAYVILADTHTLVEEKAKFLTVFRKHVTSGGFTEKDMQDLTSDAFNYATTVDVDTFLAEVAPTLSPAQKLAIVINLYDTMLVDGKLAEGERMILRKFEVLMDIGEQVMKVVREFLLIKNDTTLFTDQYHPRNERDFEMTVGLIRK